MLIVAKRGNKYGFINGLGKIKIPFIYDAYRRSRRWANTASDHITAICQNGKWGFIDTSSSEGKIIVSPQYKDASYFIFGMAWVSSDGVKRSFIDKNGNIVCGGFVVCSDFNNRGLAIIKYSKNSKDAYLINKRGDVVFYCDEDGKGNITNIRRKK